MAHMTVLTRADGSDVEVQFEYAPGTPDVYYMSNGDPGYPGDPAEVMILCAKMDDGTEVELTDEEYEEILEIGSSLYEKDLTQSEIDAYEARKDFPEYDWDNW